MENAQPIKKLCTSTIQSDMSDWTCYKWFGLDISKAIGGVMHRKSGLIIIKRNRITIVASVYNEYVNKYIVRCKGTTNLI